MKVTVVGAGAVGASCAEYIAIKDFASEVVLLDIKEGYAEGKAMDLAKEASDAGDETGKPQEDKGQRGRKRGKLNEGSAGR